jgi:hypothetical protein
MALALALALRVKSLALALLHQHHCNSAKFDYCNFNGLNLARV